MAVRSSMAALNAQVGLLINDPTYATFTAQQIQDALDSHRATWRQVALVPQPTLAAGAFTWLDYYADDPTDPTGDWEDDVVLYDNTFTVIASNTYTLDTLTGHVTFAADHQLPVYLTGKTYDVYAAAADLLEMWAARLALAYDVSADSQSLRRSQMRDGLLAVARQYRRQQRIGRMQAVRSDEGGPGLRDVWVAQHTIDRGSL